MKKLIVIVLFCLLLSSCKASNDLPHIADPNDRDPYCGEGLIYHDGVCVTSIDQTDYEVIKDTMLLYKNMLLDNDDFKNTMFESESTYYNAFFTTSSNYHISKDELIDYNVEDVIYQGAYLRVMRMIDALNALIAIDKPLENHLYELEAFNASYAMDNQNIYLNIIQDSKKLDGHYRLSQNETKDLVFDALEKSESEVFQTEVIDYIYYEQFNEYHELSYLIDGRTQHFFQYDYTFSSNTVKTFLVSTMPKYDHFDIARAERHFDDDYYVVYSKGSNYEHKYFTLFNNGHTSININHVILNPEPNHVPHYEIQWNLLDVEGWSYVENDKVYTNDEVFDITAFDTDNFSYFGPELTIFDSTGELDSIMINEPKKDLVYNIYSYNDFSIPMQRLDDLQSIMDVNQTTYIELGETKQFSDGFYDRFLNYISEDYLSNVIEIE